MKIYLQLLSSFEMDLENLELHNPFDIDVAEKGIHLCRQTLQCLRDRVVKKGFETESEECVFFKTIKPKVAGMLIFYVNCIQISQNPPVGPIKKIKSFYSEYITHLRTYFSDHRELYQYFLRQHSHLDMEYFTRKSGTALVYADSLSSLLDAQFSTPKDMVFAQILGNLKTIDLLTGKIALPKNNGSVHTSHLKWTGQKVDLVELIYALHASGLVNNGNVGIKDLALAFQKMFGIEIGDYYRTFLEIRMRKSNPAKLLDTLKTSLQNKITTADA